MVENFEGIVLRTLRYNDTLLIADVYTRQRGRASFLVPVSHSKRSKVRSVLFQPLSMLSFTASGHEGKRLWRVSSVQPYTIFSSIQANVVKSAIALFLSEVLVYALREEEPDVQLFNFLDRSFSLFDNLEEGYADFHIVFLSRLLRYLGIYPNLDNYTPGCYMDLAQGCAVNEQPHHASYLMPADAAGFVELMQTGYDSLHTLSLNRKLRGGYLAILMLYYRLHIPDFPQIKSMEVLRELFD